MGTRGPAPKRSTQRRRTSGKKTEQVAVEGAFEPPKANAQWHPTAKRWFESLSQSGQNIYYEPSDWAAAYLIAENISRDLKPKVVASEVVRDEKGNETLKSIKAQVPMTGTSLSAYLKGMTSLLVTEADRRRAQVELVRQPKSEPQPNSDVAVMDDYRARLAG